MEKKLVRVREGRMMAGICAGVGRYLGMDTTIVRVIVVLLSLFTGIVFGLIAYFVLCFVIPEE